VPAQDVRLLKADLEKLRFAGDMPPTGSGWIHGLKHDGIGSWDGNGGRVLLGQRLIT
jgi:hypothetical protein